MNVFDYNLEAIEAAGFRHSYFGGKVAAQIFTDNAVRGCKEGKDVGDKKAFSLDRLFQSARSANRSISSVVQKDASAFLYILQRSAFWIGKRTNR